MFKEVLHGNWEKECVTNRFHFLKPQASLFLIKIVFHSYLRQIAKTILMHQFSQKQKVCELHWKKKTEPLCELLRAFNIGILGLHCTLH